MDPNAPPLTKEDNSPPVGWGTTMPWNERIERWRKENRRHRKGAPLPRLLKNPNPVVIGKIPTKNTHSYSTLVFSDGLCFAPRAERRCRVGGTPPKFLELGYWMLSGGFGNPTFVGDATGARVTLQTRKNAIASDFAEKLRKINKIDRGLKQSERRTK